MAYNVKTETAGNMWKVFVKVGDAVKEAMFYLSWKL